MTKNETIVRWLGWTWDEDTGAWFAPPPMQHYQITTPSFDRIGDWHGDDGLLAEIERRELIARFMLAMREVVGITTWAHMTATPAQLAAALVKVIEEGE